MIDKKENLNHFTDLACKSAIDNFVRSAGVKITLTLAKPVKSGDSLMISADVNYFPVTNDALLNHIGAMLTPLIAENTEQLLPEIVSSIIKEASDFNEGLGIACDCPLCSGEAEKHADEEGTKTTH